MCACALVPCPASNNKYFWTGRPDNIYLSTSSCLPSDRTNLSPFTKDFRVEGQLNERLTNFFLGPAQQRGHLISKGK